MAAGGSVTSFAPAGTSTGILARRVSVPAPSASYTPSQMRCGRLPR